MRACAALGTPSTCAGALARFFAASLFIATSPISLLAAVGTLVLATAPAPAGVQSACDLHRGSCRGELPGGGYATLSSHPVQFDLPLR